MVVIEGVYRVLNNMVQKFNQCFYFYLFVDGVRAHFISIALFMPPLILMIVTLTIRAACCWYGPDAIADADADADARVNLKILTSLPFFPKWLASKL